MSENDIHTEDFSSMQNLTREQVVNKIIDMMFEVDGQIDPGLHERFIDWLFDPHDAELKEQALFRKFIEITKI